MAQYIRKKKKVKPANQSIVMDPERRRLFRDELMFVIAEKHTWEIAVASADTLMDMIDEDIYFHTGPMVREVCRRLKVTPIYSIIRRYLYPLLCQTCGKKLSILVNSRFCHPCGLQEGIKTRARKRIGFFKYMDKRAADPEFMKKDKVRREMLRKRRVKKKVEAYIASLKAKRDA